ncbi:MAG: S-layer family protein, partial [Alphaproteobacteria bacterium]|nr:S-layer family protein [Alphaproteobacteria bacterium]
ASALTASAIDVQVLTTYAANSADARSSTVHTGGYVDANGTMVQPGNTLSASVIGNTADNGIALSFTALQGDATADGEVVGATANSQVIQGASALSATLVGTGGEPVKTYIDSEVIGSTITTSYNTVAASAIGNRTTANTVTVSATNAVLASGITATTSTDLLTGDVTASAAFVAASSQEFQDATISASQVDTGGTVSNTIDTEIGGDGASTTISSIATAQNTLSATATANSASNGVFLGTDATSTIQASSAVANYQDVVTTAADAISASIGVLGTDAVPSYTSGNGTTASALGTYSYNSGTGSLTVGASTTLTFGSPLTADEAAILTGLGWTATAGSTSVTIPAGTYNISGSLSSITFNDTDLLTPGNETIAVAGFNRTATPAQLNNAGVTITANANITDSQVDVTGNTVVGEVKANTATNTLAVTGTTLTTNATLQSSLDLAETTLAPADADHVITNVQSVGADLVSDVAGSFGIVEPNDLLVTASSLAVSGNLQQSYATANTATNALTLTATNSGVAAGVANNQVVVNGSVATTSDLDVAANAGVTTSDLALDGNRNQSVATGNLETSSLTVAATNVDPATGAAAGSAYERATLLVADSFLASTQTLDGEPVISASATTDVFNRDAADGSARDIGQSTVSLSSNQTTAQATGNSSTLDGNFGDATAASYDAGAAVIGEQYTPGAETATAVTATADSRVDLTLSTDDANGDPTIWNSTVAVDGNTSTALARTNVGTITFDVTATNATDTSTGVSLIKPIAAADAGFLAYRYQIAEGTVSATSTASTYTLSASKTSLDVGDAVSASTLSLSSNASAATAVANTSTTTMRVGSDATANLDVSAAAVTQQINDAAATAIGGLSAEATFDLDGVGTSAALSNSTASVDGNTSSASATGNVATASLTATGTNVASASGLVTTVDAGAEILGSDIALATFQDNRAVIASTNTANTVTLSGTAIGTAGSGVFGSTLSLSDNAVTAYATANTASNSLTLGSASSSTVDASGGLFNRQRNETGATVTSDASGAFSVTVDTAELTGAALNASSATLSGNSVLSLARGNLATNSLTVAATSVTAGTGAGSFTGSTGVLTASYALLNDQVNSDAVSATSSGASYTVALNGNGGTPTTGGTGANASTVSLSGNSVTSAAYGNIATNGLTLTSLNGTADDASAMLTSLQSNTAAIGATVTGGFAGVTVNGAATNSTVSVGSNSFSASAVGNFATSTMTRN